MCVCKKVKPLNVLKILDRPIAFQRPFVTITGSINAALMLSQAVYWSNRTEDPDGWFYKVRDDWQEETGMTRTEQETARRTLRDLRILEEKLKGSPAKLHYRLDSKTLQKLIDNLPPSRREPRKPVGRKPANKMAGNLPTLIRTESTTETTTDISSDKRKADSRHSPFRESLSLYWKHKNPALGEIPWDASEAKQLAGMLAANPTLTHDTLKILLQNRARSDVNHQERVRKWIGSLTDYAGGPLDRYGKPKGNGNGTKSERTFDNINAALNILAANHAGSGSNGRLPVCGDSKAGSSGNVRGAISAGKGI